MSLHKNSWKDFARPSASQHGDNRAAEFAKNLLHEETRETTPKLQSKRHNYREGLRPRLLVGPAEEWAS